MKTKDALDSESIPNADALPMLNGMTENFALSVFDSSPDCMKLLELDGTLSFMNHNGQCAMEIDDFGLLAGRPWPSLWPEDARPLLDAAVQNARDGKTSSFEAFCPTAKASDRWWAVTVSPVRNAAGVVDRILANSRDITERVEFERELKQRDQDLQQANALLEAQLAEKDVLLDIQDRLKGEIDHRLKNSLALISALLRAALREVPTGKARQVLEDTSNRIKTLSQVHNQLHLQPEAKTINLKEFMEKLADDLAGSHGAEGRITVHAVQDFPIQSGDAIAIGLVVAELVANAFRHGSRGVPVEVSVTLNSAEDGTSYVCKVVDNGVGLPEPFDIYGQSGLGMRICSAYSQQLDGEMIATNDPGTGGAAFALTFPSRLS